MCERKNDALERGKYEGLNLLDQIIKVAETDWKIKVIDAMRLSLFMAGTRIKLLKENTFHHKKKLVLLYVS